MAWMHAWVSQSKHGQLLQVALMIKTSGSFYYRPHQGITHQGVGMRHLVAFSGDCMLLFKAIPMGWVMAWTTKLRKYPHVYNTAKLPKMKEHALSLNIQMSTYIYICVCVCVCVTCWFGFWQPSDLTRGLGVCLIRSYLAIQEVESLFGKIYGSTTACSIDELQLVKGMTIGQLATTRLCFSQRALLQWDPSLVIRQLPSPKSAPAWNQGMGDLN